MLHFFKILDKFEHPYWNIINIMLNRMFKLYQKIDYYTYSKFLLLIQLNILNNFYVALLTDSLHPC